MPYADDVPETWDVSGVEAWRERRHDLMDELSRVGAGMPCLSAHADTVGLLGAPDAAGQGGGLREWLGRCAAGVLAARRAVGLARQH